MTGSLLSSGQQAGLILLRTLVGWHFLYEGYFKLLRPAWTRAGAPLATWSSAGYLKAATGPFAGVFHALAESSWLSAIDTAVSAGLLAVGLSLVLGLFTQAGCAFALLLHTMFYLSAMPTSGLHLPGNEGAYLFVNKNLVEACGVFVVLVFDTGRIAGLDLLRHRPRATALRAEEVVA